MSSQNRVSPEPQGSQDGSLRYRGGEYYPLETRSHGNSATDIRVPTPPSRVHYIEPEKELKGEVISSHHDNAWSDDYGTQNETSYSYQGNTRVEASNSGNDWTAESNHGNTDVQASNNSNEADQQNNACTVAEPKHHTQPDDGRYDNAQMVASNHDNAQTTAENMDNDRKWSPIQRNEDDLEVQNWNQVEKVNTVKDNSSHPESFIANPVQDRIIGGTGEETGSLGCCGWILTILSMLVVLLTVPFSVFFCLKVVQEFERAVIFRLGRLLAGGAKGPGIFFVLPCIESYTKVDLRTVSFDVPPQEILTKDSVTVSVDAVVYYRVSNPTVSVANVENAHHATRLLAQTTLRNILGTKNMSEILTERETISNAMQAVLDGATDRWGIKVERVEIKDVRLPIQLQRAMAAEAEAAREARAKVLAAEGEHRASRALKEAAEILSQSPAALQLRYLQTLNSISAEKNSTIIFPLPIDLIDTFMSRHRK